MNLILSLIASPLLAEQMLLTLSVDSNSLKWQQEFLLTLTIYNSPDSQPPQISIDGMDQFLLRGTGKNLLQVPRGQTQKWIFTYTLTATEEGTFKVGPARTTVSGRNYYSNFLFIHVGNAPRSLTKEKPPVEEKPKEKPAVVKAPEPIKQPASPPAPNKEQPKTKPAQAPASAPASAQKVVPKEPPAKVPTAQTPPANVPAKVAPPKTPPANVPPAKVAPPKEPPPPPPEPKETEAAKKTVTVPVVLSAAEAKQKIEIVFDARKSRPYRSEGVSVVLKLLSQLPVEDLRLKEDPQFAGFLKYDLPFTTRPKGETVQIKGASYVSYDLLNFLVFPMEEGSITIPPVTCALKVRVPSGEFRDADLILNIEKSSNAVPFQVQPIPAGTVVGDFAFRNEIVTDGAQSKIVKMVLEGKGQLSTFEFPIVAGPQFQIRELSSSASASPRADGLQSRKSRDLVVTAKSNNITSIVLPSVQVRQFNPQSGKETRLTLPPLPLRFTPPGPKVKQTPPLPEYKDSIPWALTLTATALALALFLTNLRPRQKRQNLRLVSLFRRKNLKLQISRSAARVLYDQMARKILAQDGKDASLIETLRRHLPMEEWLKVERAFHALESTAYSQSKAGSITYLEMKQICEKVETLWQQ